MTWFIVVGRKFGDDEATAGKVQATGWEEAVQVFRDRLLRSELKGKANDDLPEHEHVWVDAVFGCGGHEPQEY